MTQTHQTLVKFDFPIALCIMMCVCGIITPVGEYPTCTLQYGNQPWVFLQRKHNYDYHIIRHQGLIDSKGEELGM